MPYQVLLIDLSLRCEHGLHHKLVFVFVVQVIEVYGLEHDRDGCGSASLDQAIIGSNAVTLGSGGLHFETDAPVGRVGQLEVRGDHIVERTYRED